MFHLLIKYRRSFQREVLSFVVMAETLDILSTRVIREKGVRANLRLQASMTFEIGIESQKYLVEGFSPLASLSKKISIFSFWLPASNERTIDLTLI